MNHDGLSYPFAERTPESGSSIEVIPGVRWLRMALPFALNHINLWLLQDHVDGRDGWTVIDCCIDHPQSRDEWERIFCTQLQGLPVIRVLVTHMHPDHIGLAHWLCSRWNVPLWISAADYLQASISTESAFGFDGDRAARFFQAHGLVDPEALDQIRARSTYYSNLVPALPQSYRRLLDGMRLQIGPHTWQCIAGYGHAPEHMALHCASLGVLISGDMVLPRISTNVSVYESEPEADAVKLFTDSLQRFQSIPAETLVLPSHGLPFTGLHTRIKALSTHHEERLNELMAACVERPLNAHDAMQVLFRREMNLHQTTFAMGESIAHLNRLWHEGRLHRIQSAEGIFRFHHPPT